jgi:hypothetical protein
MVPTNCAAASARWSPGLACDREQAKIVLGYTHAYFTDVPLLKQMVERETAQGFELSNAVDIAVATNSFRVARGRAVLCAILDEVAFYRSEDSATPDVETFRALEPGLASLRDSMMIGISSPYRRKGLLYSKFQKHFGTDDDDDVLVIRAPTTALNPTIDPAIIDKALRDDPEAARAEWLAEWRDDLADFVGIEALRACVKDGVHERRPERRHRYTAFVDPSGGASDSMTLAISHREADTVILDALREFRAPFNPEAAVAEFADLLKKYRLARVTGDRYAGEWPSTAFRRHGVHYVTSDRSKSEIYLDALPLLNAGAADLLDNERLLNQLAGLTRRTTRGGRDSIDHAPGAHDDLANAACGALVMAESKRTTADRDRAASVVVEGLSTFNPHAYTLVDERRDNGRNLN